jgi:hypothetical protein
MLHRLGAEHKGLTDRWRCGDMRLTDVYGERIEAILV